jgi:hypothetical protein
MGGFFFNETARGFLEMLSQETRGVPETELRRGRSAPLAQIPSLWLAG